jgi:hypothetical protein
LHNRVASVKPKASNCQTRPTGALQKILQSGIVGGAMRMRRPVRPTLHDVARHAKVSVATVSRALSRPELVNVETQQRIREVAGWLGYLPDAAGRALVSGSSRTVGIVVPTLDAAIFSRAIHGLQRRLAEAGYQLLVAAHDYSLAAEASAVRAMLAHRVDSLVLVGTDRAEETRALLRAADLPVVVIWSFDDDFPCIGFDNEAAGRLAAEHLLDLGHRRIAMISGITAQNDRARLRLAGMNQLGFDLQESCLLRRRFQRHLPWCSPRGKGCEGGLEIDSGCQGPVQRRVAWRWAPGIRSARRKRSTPAAEAPTLPELFFATLTTPPPKATLYRAPGSIPARV